MTSTAQAFYAKRFNQVHIGMILTLSAVVFCHIGSLSFLMGWDDQTFVTNHFTEDGLSIYNVRSILSEFYSWQYAPINQLYYCALFELFGYNTACFHLAGLAVHLVNSMLVYAVVLNISEAVFHNARLANAQTALLASAMFAVSTANLEPVAWVAASKVLLYALFYLLALLGYIKYLSTKRIRYFYLAIAGFILSFGAKEQAVTMPVCLLLIDYVYGRSFKDPLVWYEKAPFLILSLLFGLATLQSQGSLVLGGGNYYSAGGRVLLFFYSVSEYLAKIVLPINVSYAYPYPFQIGERPPLWMWTYPAIVPIALFCLRQYFFRKWILFGTAFFLVHIVLVGNLFSLTRYSAIADRYGYISSVGPYFLIASASMKRMNAVPLKRYTGWLLGGYLCFFSIYTNVHSLAWRNSITLKEKMRQVITQRADYKEWLKKKQENAHK